MTEPDFATDHCFYERSGDHETLMVLFNYWGLELSVRPHQRFVAAAPCNKLFLHSGRSDWFQNGIPGVADSFEGLLDFCRDMKRQFRETHFVYVGHSMGAFAALGCGLFSDADRVLASVPEVDLCQPGSFSARYLSAAELRYPSIRALLDANRLTPIELIVGLREEADLQAAREIAAKPNVSRVELDCGHETFVYLRDEGLLELTFRAFVEGRHIRAAIDDAKAATSCSRGR